jgi:cyclic pyranopterin phosphate synthase
MPEDITFRPNAELMQDDEILHLVDIFARLGFDKIRLTGGEPTVRQGIVELVSQITHLPGIRTVSMTSNGILFDRLAIPLAEAGLRRINFSLDTLDPERFQRLTRHGSLSQVFDGIRAAEQAGLLPIKVNVVLLRDYFEKDAIDMARLTLDHPWHVRFIEVMPFAGATSVQFSQSVTEAEIFSLLKTALGTPEALHGGQLVGEAHLYRFQGGLGEVGFISTVSQPFCASCTRARLTADGKLRLCLLREDEVDLLTPLRLGASEAHLRSLILEGIWRKPWGNRLAQGEVPLNRAMSEIGG